MLFRRSRWFERASYRVDDGDAARLAEAGTLVLPMRRENLLRYLPARGRVAEIGVARGRFSRRIVDVCDPVYLALIDAWENQAEAVYGQDSNNAAHDEQLARYRQVSRSFARAGTRRACEVIRGYSHVAVERFADASFDWVYVDANHGHDACLQDLRAWSAKVKPDGFLCGHDFAHHAAAAGRFGVVEAVFAFLAETGFHLLAMTVEHFPTFVVVKNRHAPGAKRFVDLLLTFEEHVMAVPQESVRSFGHARILDSHGKRASFMQF